MSFWAWVVGVLSQETMTDAQTKAWCRFGDLFADFEQVGLSPAPKTGSSFASQKWLGRPSLESSIETCFWEPGTWVFPGPPRMGAWTFGRRSGA